MSRRFYEMAVEFWYRGQYERVVECVSRYLLTSTSVDAVFKKAFYLKLEALRFLGRYNDTRTLLEEIPFEDNSFDYLKAVRKAVDSNKSVPWFFSKIMKYKSRTKDVENTLFNCGVLMRDLGKSEEAIFYFKERFFYMLNYYEYGSTAGQKKSKLWSNQAAVALIDLKAALDSKNIEFFLKGGVLLGCVREGKILDHDYDIDVGVDERFDRKLIEEAIAESGNFSFRENNNSKTIYISHKNGVVADIFIHYLEGGLYKNRGMYVTWKNKPFDLVETSFLGGSYLIPSSAESYLSETYGDWKKPAPNYNTYTDNLNTEINDERVMAVYYLNKMTSCYMEGAADYLLKILDAYIELTRDYSVQDLVREKLDAHGIPLRTENPSYDVICPTTPAV